MKYIFVFFCFAISLISCQKDFSIDNLLVGGQTTNQLLNDSNTLVRYIDLDTTLPAGSDTQDIQTYSYDANKRLVRSEYKEYPGYGSFQEESKLYYIGTDTLPFLKTVKKSNSGILDFDTTYYFYSLGKWISDSTRNPGYGYKVRHYTYEASRIIETINGNPPHFVYFIKSGNNTIMQTDTISGNINKFVFAYDTKKNPFFGLFHTSSDRDDPYYNTEIYSEDMTFEKNNPTDITESHAFLSHNSYTYEYKANGYPSIARYRDDTNALISKRIFVYTRLP